MVYHFFMKCYNCGYINFQRVKKCRSCNTSLKGTQSHVELAEDPTFTVFAGEPPGFGSGDDSDTALDEEFGAEETVSDDGDFGLDLDEAEGADADFGEPEESPISAGMASDVGPNDFELDLSEAIAEQIMASSSPTPADDALDLDPTVEADDALDLEPTVEADAGADLDIEGIGFDAGEPEAVEVATDDLDLDLGTEDDEPTLDLDTEPELELAPEVDVDTGEGKDIEFSLDDEAEPAEAATETAEPAEEKADEDEEGGIDFGDLEMEDTPDKEK